MNEYRRTWGMTGGLPQLQQVLMHVPSSSGGLFSIFGALGCWGTYAEGGFQKRVVILREIYCNLGDILQRVIAHTPELERLMGG